MCRDLFSGSQCSGAGAQRRREEQYPGVEIGSDEHPACYGGNEANMTAVLTKKKTAKKGIATKKKALRKKASKRRDGAPESVKSKLYASLVVQLLSLLKGEHDFIANAANFSALLFNSLPNVN